VFCSVNVIFNIIVDVHFRAEGIAMLKIRWNDPFFKLLPNRREPFTINPAFLSDIQSAVNQFRRASVSAG